MSEEVKIEIFEKLKIQKKHDISRVWQKLLLMTSLQLADFEESVTRFTKSVDVQLCKKVVDNFTVRLNACVNRKGKLIEHVNYHALA